jgi:predicted phage-related endonuclease
MNQAPTADVTVGRKNYIGSSEAASVINLPPYGCALSLLLDKCGIGNDEGVPDINPRMAERGHMLEPIVAQLFADEADAAIYFLDKFQGTTAAAHPWLVSHADYGICTPTDAVQWAKLCKAVEDGPHAPISMPADNGLLECKTAGTFTFRKVLKEGPLPYNLMQIQHQLITLDITWGVLWYLCPESFERKGFLIGRDEELRDKYLATGDGLWQKIEDAKRSLTPADSPDRWTEFGVDRLPADSMQCKKCKRRKSCQGEALMQILKMPGADHVAQMDTDPRWGEAVAEYMKLRSIEAQAKDAANDKRRDLEALMGDSTCAEGAGVRIYWKPQPGRVSVDGKGMVKELNELADAVEAGGTIKFTDGRLAETLRKIAAKKNTAKATRPFKPFAV